MPSTPAIEEPTSNGQELRELHLQGVDHRIKLSDDSASEEAISISSMIQDYVVIATDDKLKDKLDRITKEKNSLLVKVKSSQTELQECTKCLVEGWLK